MGRGGAHTKQTARKPQGGTPTSPAVPFEDVTLNANGTKSARADPAYARYLQGVVFKAIAALQMITAGAPTGQRREWSPPNLESASLRFNFAPNRKVTAHLPIYLCHDGKIDLDCAPDMAVIENKDARRLLTPHELEKTVVWHFDSDRLSVRCLNKPLESWICQVEVDDAKHADASFEKDYKGPEPRDLGFFAPELLLDIIGEFDLENRPKILRELLGGAEGQSWMVDRLIDLIDKQLRYCMLLPDGGIKDDKEGIVARVKSIVTKVEEDDDDDDDDEKEIPTNFKGDDYEELSSTLSDQEIAEKFMKDLLSMRKGIQDATIGLKVKEMLGGEVSRIARDALMEMLGVHNPDASESSASASASQMPASPDPFPVSPSYNPVVNFAPPTPTYDPIGPATDTSTYDGTLSDRAPESDAPTNTEDGERNPKRQRVDDYDY